MLREEMTDEQVRANPRDFLDQFNADDKRQLLIAYKALMMEKADGAGDGCPVCGQFVKMYRRHIYHSMVVDWLELMNRAESRTFSSQGKAVRRAAGGDLLKLRFWDLIEADPDSVGIWHTTDKGVAFLRGEIRVPKVALIYNSEFYGYENETETVGVRDCLKDKFDLDKAMGCVVRF